MKIIAAKEDSLVKIKAQVAEQEKELKRRKKFSENCQNQINQLQKDNKSTTQELETVSRHSETLRATIESQKREIKGLKKENETHNQIAIELFYKVDFQNSENDTLSGSKESKEGKGPMQNKKEKLNSEGIKKATEIKESQIRILEKTIKDLQRNDKILYEKLSISLAEQQRERGINNSFLRTCTCKSSSRSSKF